MESIENKIFEKKYPSSGCIFFPLGLLMAGLALLLTAGCVWAIISFLTESRPLTIKANDFSIIPVIVILWCLVYFCFSRCFSRIPIGIYPTHITIDNKIILWSDIKCITFYKQRNYNIIEVGLNNKKSIQQITILLILLIIAISLTSMIFIVPYNPSDRVGMVSGFIFVLPAMFGIDIYRPRTRGVSIESKDLEEVFLLTKYYADLYHIPLENKIDEK